MKAPLWMAPSEPRCSGRACARSQPCARKDIQDNVRRPLADFSVPGGSHYVECNAPMWKKWVAHSEAVRPVAKPEPREWIGQ
jgi:hypothetical protein